MNKIANHTALKEWASVIDALGSGPQVGPIRKGGRAGQCGGAEPHGFYLCTTSAPRARAGRSTREWRTERGVR